MVEVRLVAGRDLAGALKLLEQSSRDGEPLSSGFAALLREEVEQGGIELLDARLNESMAGVAFLAFRPSISAGDYFASIEELYVKPEARRRGIGQALLDAVEQRCALKHVSYVEVQAVDEEAVAFYRASGYELEAGVRVLSRLVALRKDGG